ncbi:unnamed protein product [Pelagomonas calceolata]|uniref:Lon N-terminal domain-containing protein n=1 Tax=Pelagomonas calceolata TaxID=35677 RepID=A0A8J2SZM8_9STRA|nr:unnamed protein product [Pelagomonas calceolata]
MARRWTSCALACVAVSAFAPPSTRIALRHTTRRATPELEAPPDIRWLAKLNPQQPDREPSGANGTMVLPLFPLGAVAYTPGSTQVLNIFEPRYRKMYSDILMSGGRRFVTTMVNSEDSDTLAEVGVVLYLEDLKEVSQQTNDAVKYVCSHKVLDSRVRIKHVLNEGDSRTRETYLRCEVEELVDDDETDEESSEVSQLEAAVRDSLRDVADMQDQGKEDVRFSRDAVGKLEASRGVGSGSLWGVVELWKNFLDARAQAAGRRVQQDVQNRLIKYLSEKNGGSGDKQLPQSVNLSELPADLQRDVRTLRDRVMEDVGPLVEEQTSGVQRLVQASSHAERLRLFERMVANEKNRLLARKTLRNTLASLEDKFNAPAAEKPSSDEGKSS